MVQIIDYETEFEELLIDLMQKNYGIQDNIILYFILRFMLINEVPDYSKISHEKFCLFLLKENGLPEKIIYKEQEFNILFGTSSLMNIVFNWFFDIEKQQYRNVLNKEFISNTYQTIINKAYSNSSKFKKENFYKTKIEYEALKLLNEQFNIKLLENFEKIENLKYDESQYIYRERILEEKLSYYKDILNNSLSFISEKVLENYLRKNIEIIEEGLKIVQCQYAVQDGFIDILAKDKNGLYVIIELKIKENDERIVWQSIYYPIAIKESLRQENVRMIIVAPSLKDSIKKSLDTLKDIEIFYYKIELKDLNIERMSLKKIS